jgi:hypothetical protein
MDARLSDTMKSIKKAVSFETAFLQYGFYLKATSNNPSPVAFRRLK